MGSGSHGGKLTRLSRVGYFNNLLLTTNRRQKHEFHGNVLVVGAGIAWVKSTPLKDVSFPQLETVIVGLGLIVLCLAAIIEAFLSG